MSEDERDRAVAIQASEERIAKARAAREQAQEEVMLASARADQERRLKELNETAAREEAKQRRSAIQAHAQYIPKTEEWEVAERRLIETYAWRTPTDEELAWCHENLVDEVICVAGYGVGVVQAYKPASGWMGHAYHSVDFSPLIKGLKDVRLKEKHNNDTPWLKYVSEDEAEAKRLSIESALAARGHQLWSDAAAFRAFEGIQHDAHIHRAATDAALEAEMSAADAETQVRRFLKSWSLHSL